VATSAGQRSQVTTNGNSFLLTNNMVIAQNSDFFTGSAHARRKKRPELDRGKQDSVAELKID
jgi:hypothetical protein